MIKNVEEYFTLVKEKYSLIADLHNNNVEGEDIK